MSKLKVKGHISGTGSVTLEAPNTNSDVTLTLPDTAGEVLTSASSLDSSKLSGALPAIDGSALTGVGGGLEEVDVWRLTTTMYGNGTYTEYTLTNMERVDNAVNTKVGTGLSFSGGVFSFPSTGVYVVTYHGEVSATVDYGGGTAGMIISATQNNSTYQNIAKTQISSSSGRDYGIASGIAIINVTDVSNVKFKILAPLSKTGDYLLGSTSESRTSIIVKKVA